MLILLTIIDILDYIVYFNDELWKELFNNRIKMKTDYNSDRKYLHNFVDDSIQFNSPPSISIKDLRNNLSRL